MSSPDHGDEALILTICLAGGTLLTVGWFVVTTVIPYCERAATDAERAAYKNLAVVSDMAIAILQKGIADRDTVIALQTKTLELYSTLVEKLTAQLNKPRSAWQKFIQTVEKVVLLAAGVALGRGL